MARKTKKGAGDDFQVDRCGICDEARQRGDKFCICGNQVNAEHTNPRFQPYCSACMDQCTASGPTKTVVPVAKRRKSHCPRCGKPTKKLSVCAPQGTSSPACP